MALDTYANLKTAVAGFIDVSTTDLSAGIDDIVTIAEKRIWRECRVKEMEKSLSATISITGSEGVVALPSDYLDLKYAKYIDTAGNGYNLTLVTAEEARNRYPDSVVTSRPELIFTELTNFYVKPTPNVGTFELRGVYYGRTLPVSTTVHTLFAANPDLYLAAAVALGASYVKNTELMREWEVRYATIRNAINMENKRGQGYAKAHYL